MRRLDAADLLILGLSFGVWVFIGLYLWVAYA